MVEQTERPDILTLGVLNVDVVMELSHKIIGGKIIGNEISLNTGGHGCNQAIGIARRGVSVGILGKLGEDAFAVQIKDTLAKEGVCLNLLLDAHSTNTGLGIIMVEKEKKNTYIDFLGANYQMTPEDIDSFESYIKECKMVVIHLGFSTYGAALRLIELANKYGKTVVVNPSSSTDMEEALLKQIDYLVLNYAKASSLLNMAIDNLKGARVAANLLLNQIKKAIFVQMDDQGVLVATQEEFTVLDAYSVSTTADMSGVTDFFTGVLSAELVNGAPLSFAAIKAHRAAMICAGKIGVYTAFPTKEEMDAI